MDRKSIFILVLSIAGLLLWFPLVNKLYPPQEPSPEQSVDSSGQTGNENGTAGALANLSEATALDQENATAPAISAQPRLAGNHPHPDNGETELTWANEDIEYLFTSRSGGIKAVYSEQSLMRPPYERRGSRHETEKVKLNAGVLTPALNIYFDRLDIFCLLF